MFSIFYGKEKLAPSPNKIDILRSLVGGTVSIFILLWLSKVTHNIFIMAPLQPVYCCIPCHSHLWHSPEILYLGILSQLLWVCFF